MIKELKQRKIYISTPLTDYVVLGEAMNNPQFSMQWLLKFKNNASKALGATNLSYSQKALEGKLILEDCIGLSPGLEKPNITSVYKGFINIAVNEIVFITDNVDADNLGDIKLREQEKTQQLSRKPFLWEIKSTAGSDSYLIITGVSRQISDNILEPNKSYLNLGKFIIMESAEMVRVYPHEGYAKIIFENKFIAINENYIKIKRRIEDKSQGVSTQLKTNSAYKLMSKP